MLRMAAVFMASTFMSIYLYDIGYSIMTIAWIWVAFFSFKSIMALFLARVVAWIGPKHAILYSNFMYIPAMISFALLPEFGPWLLPVTLALQGVSAGMYQIAYLIDFSKVKNIEHAGKEIAYMNIFEKITTGISPLIGGFIAFIWGPQVVLVIAGILFAFAAMPLLRTGEQIKTNQKLQFKGFPWRLFFRHVWAQSAIGFDSVTSGTVWTLYVAVVILSIDESGDSVYASVGALLSVVFVVAILASYTYGKLIDKKKGADLMKVGTIVSSLTHIARPFATTPLGILGVNISHEVGATGYSLPYTRAVFDNADLSGARVTYLGLNEAFSNLGAAVAALAFIGLLLLFPEQVAMQLFFFLAAGVMLLILTARFPLFKR
jgi:MFS family permease